MKAGTVLYIYIYICIYISIHTSTYTRTYINKNKKSIKKRDYTLEPNTCTYMYMYICICMFLEGASRLRVFRQICIVNLLVCDAIQERLALLRQWVKSGNNADSCEASVVLEKTSGAKLDRDRELLKISEMVARGFSETLGR